MMSSDGSITSSSASRIRQFGLYRTIDARTEEFLRLSRKRQIRQGCACATVSTAITVTVVVSVLLVYEYSISSETNRNKNYVMKPHWLGLINDSADVTPYDAKFPSKLNIDKTTLKLLPTILKALNKNKFLDKMIENHPNPVSYERRDTTEFSLQKNIFSDTKKWFKMQTPRLYAIAFKTSPVLYYRSPTKNIEYFTKNRKIRDYQRMLNYFDKMISEKVNYGATSPIIKGGITHTDKPSVKSATVSIKKHYNLKTIKHAVQNLNKNVKISANEDNCKCPRKISDLIGKLISNINQFLPYVSKMSLSTLCKSRESPKLNTHTSSTHPPTISVSFNKLIEPITSPQYEKIKAAANSLAINSHGSFLEKNQNEYLQKNVYNFPLPSNTNDETYESNKDTLSILNKPTSSSQKNVIEATEPKETLQTTTKSMQTIKDRINKLILHAAKGNVSNQSVTATEHQTFLSNEEYEDYFATTPYARNDYDLLDLHNLEFVKKKKKSAKNQGRKLNKGKTPKKSKSKPENILFSSFRTFKQMDARSKSRANEGSFLSMFKYKQTTTKPQHYINNLTKKILHICTTESKKINETQQNYNEILKLDKIHYISNSTFDEDVDKVLPDEQFQEYEEINQIDNTQRLLNKNSSEGIQNSNAGSVKSYDAWKITKIPEIIISKSMLPANRPLYLEINRNDWKQDEHVDFDMNLNNNIFDLPPI